ncbi:U3 small nucleolar ribonucleoprotein protein Lcp5p [[Candida] railenensis]|uniref:U3 small nucleolar ribonucleoprotein protein Lcp5p n=1 Tax=[Candida] railenensis TaxID=45579 RepID=A0A9P0QS34_9ASCO|nr:U3 small nucleolar ribonucleoprotein protein Lcp5p [[Candida] railenensis]
MDDCLHSITSSLDSTITSIAKIIESVKENEHPQMIQELLKQHNIPQLEGVSLLTLKNNSLLSYLNNLVIILLAKLQEVEEESSENFNSIEAIRSNAIENTIVQRVNLEKGIKPLEKRLSYQLDKMIRSYNRMESEEQDTRKSIEQSSNNRKKAAGSDSESGSESGSEDDSDFDSEAEDDNLQYKPDVQALTKLTPKDKHSKSAGKSSTSSEKYKPPKISAVEPPKPIASASSSSSSSSNRKLQSMEEYLNENSDQPTLETSIGAAVVDHGKGGVRTNKEREKEREIQRYEETNFTRLPNAATKKSFKEKQSDLVNKFAGEDWSIFNNKRSVSESTSRKRKPNTAWDRVKKRRS